MICVEDNFKPSFLFLNTMGHEVDALFDTKRRVMYSRNTSLFDTPGRVKNAVSGETRSSITLNQITSDMHNTG